MDERNMYNEQLEQAIVDMAVEAWRFRRVFNKAMSKLDAGESTRYLSQFNWFVRKVQEALEKANMRIVNIEGQEYDPGQAVVPMNIDDFEEEDILYVDQLIEPIIMKDDRVVKTGSAILGRMNV